jgi:small subunit ribosomal protein S4
MNKKNPRAVGGKNTSARAKQGEQGAEKRSPQKRQKKISEYGKQLQEKQKVKHMYGVLEKQFRRFFKIATRQEGAPGQNLLNLLERRLDNVMYRLKLSVTLRQARQVIVHGHVVVNGKKVRTPSFFVSIGDVITLKDATEKKEKFLEAVIDKRLNIGIKVPEWLELDKKARKGSVLRYPVRSDIQVPIEEHLIVELYSK